MSNIGVFTNFRHVNLTRNRYLRGGEWAITDANLEFGDLRPFASPRKVCDVPETAKTLYPIPDCCCLTFDQCADPVHGFCATQHFYLRDGILRQADEDELCAGESCRAGVPLPEAPQVTSSCSAEQCDGVGMSYVITWVTTHAGIEVEGSPSRPSDTVAVNGHIPNATVSWDLPPEDFCITSVRVYRVESEFEDGTTNMPIEGSEYVLVGEFDPMTGQILDDVPTHETLYPLTTSHPMRFQAADNLVSLTRTEDGIVVADKHHVYISLPGQPMFTFDGVVQVEDEIQVIRAIGNVIFVITDNRPVRIEFKHTEGVMSINRTTQHRHLPLRSRASVSVYGSEVYWASEHSLMVWSIAGYGADIKDALRGVFNREQYHRFHAESIVGTAYEYGYLMYSKKVGYSFMIEQVGSDQPTVMPITYVKPDIISTTYAGKLLYKQNGCMVEWDYRRDICDHEDIFSSERSPDCQPWHARLQFISTGKNRFKVARVEWDNRTAPSVTFRLHEAHYGNDSDITGEYEVINSRGFGICGYTSADNHYVSMESCGIVHEVRIATAFADLVGRSNQDIVG